MINSIIVGNSLEKLKDLKDNSIDSIVTDPPYELGFMGKAWDSSGIAFSVELWAECLRVLKPGGYLLSFGGTRTWHRMAVGIEDAGFEIRDNLAWIYGTGFPKSLNIGKSIEAKLLTGKANQNAFKNLDGEKAVVSLGYNKSNESDDVRPNNYNGTETTINHILHTPEAKQYEGWGTALKPAFEPIVMARKPLSEKTVAANVLKHGTGGINIDGSRIPFEGKAPTGSGVAAVNSYSGKYSQGLDVWDTAQGSKPTPDAGRFPSNLLLDETTAGIVDEQSGQSKATPTKGIGFNGSYVYGTNHNKDFDSNRGYTDAGGASRFFYVSKPGKSERVVLDGVAHPTVKPLTLMRYLIKMVTPVGGVVLDPFTGSGTTIEAAILEGFNYVGIELTADYIPLIEYRIERAVKSLEV